MKIIPIAKRWGWVLICALLIVVPGANHWIKSSLERPKIQDEDWVDKTIDQMTLEEKVGQLFIVGFHNGDAPAYEMNQQAKRLISQKYVGGIILFDRNVGTPRQVGELSNQLQRTAQTSSSGIPLLISVDQEGGAVARLKQGVTLFPGNMVLGASRDEKLAYQAGKVTASELRAMGINMDFAPSLDINNQPANPIIGVRSYGSDPTLVSKMGIAQMRGFRDGNVLSVVKHFPGHGDTSTDSHIGLPTVDQPYSRLNNVELRPFKAAIKADADAIMSAHITFPAIDPTPGLPGTLSKKVLTGLLRERLGYQGVIITDDMEMGAIIKNYGTAEATVRAVKAGADLILISHDLTRQEQSINAVLNAVHKGIISEKRINDSLRRILKMKAKKLDKDAIVKSPMASVHQIKNRVGTSENKSWALRVAQQGSTLIRNQKHVLPLSAQKTPELLVASPVEAEEMGKAFQKRGFQTSVRSLDPKMDAKQVAKLRLDAKEMDAIILGAYQWKTHPDRARLAQAFEKTGKPVVVVGLDTPYDLMAAPHVKTYLAVYGYRPVSMEAAAEVITGTSKAKGRLPVSIPGLYPAGTPSILIK
ncbi:beta-N-acetylhexosaminidase [Marininema mesophilum]|uniref:beta-N-acetylhexosaminidase n=1 Tax=Marininema mesophilum TaxID=1048340 RepID=A0A1H3C050_9BACL|nr:beta-N-acetylhexosaminidase [Marininema mesophilum]SDX47318.1 beta-N-acetylhexosaminidase [Marininema mesophilum]